MGGEERKEENKVVEKFICLGAWLLIPLGVLHAVHVSRSDDVEPYLWVGSLFLIIQGVMTLVFLKARHTDSSP